MSMRRRRGNKTPVSVIIVIFIAIALSLATAYFLPPALSKIRVLTFMMLAVAFSLGGVFILSKITRK